MCAVVEGSGWMLIFIIAKPKSWLRQRNSRKREISTKIQYDSSSRDGKPTGG